jgi:hypothetical protein
VLGVLGSQHLVRMRRNVICALFSSVIFFLILSLKQQGFRIKVIEYKIRVLMSSNIYSATFLILIRNEQDVYLSSRKVPVILVRF